MSNDDTPRPGDIGLVPMAGAAGFGIQIGQWLNGEGTLSPYDEKWHHAYVVVGRQIRGDDYPGDAMKVVEAMPGGALLTPLRKYDRVPRLYLRCPEEYRSAVADAALRCIGVPYSAADYFAIALHRFRVPAPGLRRYIESSKSMICSQLADRAAELGGWHIFEDGRWHGYVTPLSLATSDTTKFLMEAGRG